MERSSRLLPAALAPRPFQVARIERFLDDGPRDSTVRAEDRRRQDAASFPIGEPVSTMSPRSGTITEDCGRRERTNQRPEVVVPGTLSAKSRAPSTRYKCAFKGFESRRPRHSTRFRLASRRAGGSLMASHRQGECPERAKRVEGQPRIPFSCFVPADEQVEWLTVSRTQSSAVERGVRQHRFQQATLFGRILRFVENFSFFRES
jgi:hypothetical protein